MKYFLVASLLCTVFSVQASVARCGVNLGTIEIWSDWRPFAEDVDGEKVCAEIVDSYNELNESRGYWGQLEDSFPVAHQFRPVNAEPTERRMSCRIRVKKFDLE